MHLAVSATYGVIFGVLSGALRRRVPVWLLALAYAAGLYLLAVLATATGAGPRVADFAPPVFALAHAVYGLGLGWRFWRRERSETARAGKR
ncbi:MAG TPA: hypothetical protein VMT46_19205 [Anaerolineaceae bacterium]|nr:hypothetical protein [Anaerolineaceae bacterium]